MSCVFCHYFKKEEGEGEKGGGKAMQSNRFQGWLLLHKATCGHSHLAGASTWRSELLWTCWKKEPGLRAVLRREGRAIIHPAPSQLPPSSHRSEKLSSSHFHVALSLSSCCSRRSQKLQVDDWWVQLPSGTFNTPRTRGCWWWKLSYLSGRKSAKGLWRWAVCPFLWQWNNCYCTLPFFFFLF